MSKLFVFAGSRGFARRSIATAIIVLAALAVSSFAACGSSTSSTGSTRASSTGKLNPTVQKSTLPSITIKAMDDSYDQPTAISAGYVAVSLINDGLQPHQDNIIRLNDGIDVGKFMDTLKDPKTQGKAIAMGAFYGGPNIISPGQTEKVILHFTPGTYVSLCFVMGLDKIPHFAKGMFKVFAVTPAPPNTTQIPPAVDATVLLKNFSFVLPASLPAGNPVMVQVTNQGDQPHELIILKLHTGETVRDAVDFIESHIGSQPFDYAGGMGVLKPGSSAEVELNLQPGIYGTVCLVPDAKTGIPHAMLDMLGSFTVA